MRHGIDYEPDDVCSRLELQEVKQLGRIDIYQDIEELRLSRNAYADLDFSQLNDRRHVWSN